MHYKKYRACNDFFLLLFQDPHVRIVGKNSDVMKAKEQILHSLDSRVSRKQQQLKK